MTSLETIKIIIDHRESKSSVADWLRQEKNAAVMEQHLLVGDYVIDDRLIFERKTLLDFATSVKDGRLFRQMQGLLHTGKKCALLLEGTTKDLENSQMRREALQGALIHLTMFMGVPVLRAMDAQESAQLMLYAAQQDARQDARLDQKNLVVKRQQPNRIKGKQKRQLYLLQGLPGIGPQRARALLGKFGSIEKILQADAKELHDVPGIGYQTVENIQWILKENETAYGTWFPEL